MAEQTQQPALHHGQMRKCGSCKALIVWAYIMLSGKKAPFQLDDKGEWEIEHGTARHVGAVPTQLELGAPARPQRYTNHFATCPDSAKWRRKK